MYASIVKRKRNNLSAMAEDSSYYLGRLETLDPLLLPYQLEWVKAAQKHTVCVAEKSRRIGLTWVDALISVMDGIKGINTTFASYNKEAAIFYIQDAGRWAKYLNTAYQITESRSFIDDDEILTYKMRFGNGATITAVSSSEDNFRAKKGNVVIDEAAFGVGRDLDKSLDAALPLTIWGGRIRVISTHNGVDSKFLKLCNDIREGKKKYYLLFCTFRDAVRQGLYKRICFMKGETWSQEKEDAWVTDIYEKHGGGASQELDVIPSDSNIKDIIFKKHYFKKTSSVPDNLLVVRSWDLAATENDTSFYTAGVKLGLAENGIIYVLDARAQRLSPLEGDAFMVATAYEDGEDCLIVIESEPGSTSLKWEAYIEQQFTGFVVNFIKPVGNKLSRAVPAAGSFNSGETLVLDSHWSDDYIKNLRKFDGSSQPLVNDLVDATSAAFGYLKSFNQGLFGT